MDHRPDVQLNQRKITFQLRLQERAADDPTGVQRQHIYRSATLLYCRGDAFIAVERRQVCLQRRDGRTVVPQPLRRLLEPLLSDYEDLEALGSAHLCELIADAAGPSRDHSESSALAGVHVASCGEPLPCWRVPTN